MLVGLLGPLIAVSEDGALLTVPAAPKERAVLEMLAPPLPGGAQRGADRRVVGGDMMLVGQALCVSVFPYFEDAATAVRLSREALEVLRGNGDALFEVFTLNNLGVVYDFAGDVDQARTCTEQALTVAGRLGFGFPIGVANLGEFLIRQGHPETAVGQLRAALGLARRYSPRDVLVTMQPIVGLAVALGEWQRGAQLQGYVTTAWAGAGFQGAVATDEFSRGNVALMRSQLGTSFDTYYAAGASLDSPKAIALAQDLTRPRPDRAG
jgi:tetratricopeptide (TPR) repeat protein